MRSLLQKKEAVGIIVIAALLYLVVAPLYLSTSQLQSLPIINDPNYTQRLRNLAGLEVIPEGESASCSISLTESMVGSGNPWSVVVYSNQPNAPVTIYAGANQLILDSTDAQGRYVGVAIIMTPGVYTIHASVNGVSSNTAQLTVT